MSVGLKTFIFAVGCTLGAVPVFADQVQPKPFFSDALEQDGKITLSPGFSPDGETMYFAQSECYPIWECPQRLKVSNWTGETWSAPKLVLLPAEGRVDDPSVTPDGETLLFSWSAPQARHAGMDVYENFDLYSLDLTDPAAVPEVFDTADINRLRAGKVKKLRYVNNETAPSVTVDGDLYFWAERLDGLGERDVYLAKADGQGGFDEARPLPAPINSTGRDDGVWVHPNGNLMLITYSDRGGVGGADLFASVKRDGVWIEPIHLGPAVNSSRNDFAGRITPDGKTLVFTSNRAGPNELYGLWSIPLDDVPPLRELYEEAV